MNEAHPDGSRSGAAAAGGGALSLLAAWAMAFGCAVGWDAIELPGTTFLPKAGPLGTVLGVLAGGLVMAVVAWNYHVMINRHPGPGGVYAYAAEAFGIDHGFIGGWFLCLTYMAIVWMDATALVAVVRHLVGTDLLAFGFRYDVAGHEVWMGHILLSAAAIALAAAVCCRRRLAYAVQTALALALAAGIAACAGAAAGANPGGLRALAPAFSPDPAAGSPLMQVLGIVALSPWLFVGFESISNLSGDFRFPAKRSFGVMVAALGTTVLAYALLAALPALVPAAGGTDWADGLARLGGAPYPAYGTAIRLLGRAGPAVVGAMAAGALFTNLVGNTVAASRLLAAMASDGTVPRWFGGTNAAGAPRNAVLAIAAVAVVVSALGYAVLEIVADIAVVGAGVAYAYTSAAAVRTAHGRLGRAAGVCGLVLSVAVAVLFILPNFAPGTASMGTMSYLVVVLWCIAGLACFLFAFRRDRGLRLGQSPVVWLSLLAMVLAMSVLWIRQSTSDTTQRAFDDIVRRHTEICMASGEDDGGGAPHCDDYVWMGILRTKLAAVNRSIVINSLVQIGLTALSFALLFCLYAVLRRRERELETERARAKSYFFSTVSHDIRTPLNAIIGFSEMLKTGFDTDAEREQAVDSIIVSGRTLLGLVNDILDLSKLESGKMEIVPEPTDCPRLLRGVMASFRATAGKPGLELRCRVGEMPPLMLDPQRLRQIVFNIVGNAVKFTERGHVELRAAYDWPEGAETGTFRLEVEDTGCGIAPADLARIGSAYVQVGNGTRHARNGGTGLGLAICRQLAAAMGGTLGIESEPGRGSVFSVEIPGVRPASAAPAEEDELAAAEPPAAGALAVRRILLVDDSRMNLMVLQAFLKHLGQFEIALAADGREALDLLRTPGTAPYDLVLTDMWMPNLDGEGLVRAVRADPALASLRVVIVTADVELQSQAAAMGFDDILFKPVTASKLAQVLAGKA